MTWLLAFAQDERWNAWIAVAAPVAVATVVAAGLLLISINNLRGAGRLPETRMDHSSAVHRIFFRG